jgi:predicted ATPase/DNA-binding XRE family transcriptional regulator/Tfp pilus assembly protein PilF
VNVQSSFGSWLKDRRKLLDLTQEELAMRVGCSLEMIQKIEAGKRRPSKQMSERLAQYLGVESGERTVFVRFARGEAGPEEGPYARDSEVPHNLPAQLTPLIGRETDVDAVRSYIMREDVRLLTLTGPPGIGKTRLGLQVASELLHEFQDGVFFVMLAPIADPQLVMPTVAKTLGLVETPTQAITESLLAFLRRKRLLLLLDNFEQVVAAAEGVADLLIGCPGIKVLVTSRGTLRVHGERQFPVPALVLPDAGQLAAKGDGTVETLAQNPAVALFVQSAQAVHPDFALTLENAQDVAAICTRLEGLPLAIELVAARIKLLPPHGIVSKLGNQLVFPTGGQRNMPMRHHTLSNAISWSYDLLSPAEQTLFRRLGVFVGGCTLDAIEAVCNARADLPVSLLQGIESLLDKSLLKSQFSEAQEPTGEGSAYRFTILETIREYARERLDESSEAEAIKQLHAEYYLALAEAADPQFTRGEYRLWLNRLDKELDNIRAALHWTSENDIELGLRLASALWLFWELGSYVAEGRGWLARMLASPHATRRTLGRAKALHAAGFLAAVGHRNLDAAHNLSLESMDIGRELVDKRIIAYAILNLAYPGNGGYPETRQLLSEAMDIFRESGDKWGIGGVLHHMGAWEYLDGNYSEARRLFRQALEVQREIGEPFTISATLKMLGMLELQQGNHAEARAIYEEIIPIKREWGNKEYLAGFLHRVGDLARHQGDYDAAAAYLKESLVQRGRLDNKSGIAWCLLGLASIAEVQARNEHLGLKRAATLLALVERLLNDGTVSLPPDEQDDYGELVADTRLRLDEVDWSAAQKVASTMTLDEAIAYALEETQ